MAIGSIKRIQKIIPKTKHVPRRPPRRTIHKHHGSQKNYKAAPGYRAIKTGTGVKFVKKTPGVIQRITKTVQRALPENIIPMKQSNRAMLGWGEPLVRDRYINVQYGLLVGKVKKQPGLPHFSYPFGDHPQVKTAGKNRVTHLGGKYSETKNSALWKALRDYQDPDDPSFRGLLHDTGEGKVGGSGIPFHSKKVSYSRHGTLLEHKRDQATVKELKRIAKETNREEQRQTQLLIDRGYKYNPRYSEYWEKYNAY